MWFYELSVSEHKQMIKDLPFLLPHEMRRRIISVACPSTFRYFAQMRQANPAAEYSYKQFDERKCIFVHIPKAAGVSVCRSLFGNLGGGHASVAVYQVAFGKNEFDSYFKFTFVRNPWDRLLSAFRFLRKGGMTARDRRWSEENLAGYRDFDEFVKKWVNKENISSYTHFVPQYRFLCLPFSRKPAVDFIGHYENLNDDFRYIQCRILGCTGRPLMHQNRTSAEFNGDYREHYTDESRDIVAEVYRRDIAMFHYRFDRSHLDLERCA